MLQYGLLYTSTNNKKIRKADVQSNEISIRTEESTKEQEWARDQDSYRHIDREREGLTCCCDSADSLSL